MKKYIIIITVIILTSYFGYDYWKSTPQYSIQKVVESIESNDIYLFEKHFDIDKVADKMSDEFVIYMTKENIDTTDEDEWGLLGKEFATSFMGLMKPFLSNQISSQISGMVDNQENDKSLAIDSVTNGLFNSSDFNFMNQEKISLFLGLVFDAEKIKFERDGSTTSLLISLNQANELINIEIILKKYEDYWKITEIKNLIIFILENQES